MDLDLKLEVISNMTCSVKYEEKREEEGTFQFLITGPARSVK